MINKKIIQSILNCKNKTLKDTDNLSKYTWDSMSMISLISILEKKTKKKIKAEKIRELKNIKDLDRFINRYSK